MKRRRGRRRRKLLDDLKDRRGYSHLKEEALDRTMWRNRFGGGFELVIRQNTEWMNRNVYSLRDNYSIINLPMSKIHYKNNPHLLKTLWIHTVSWQTMAAHNRFLYPRTTIWLIIALFRCIVVPVMEIQWCKVENLVSLVRMNRYGGRFGFISCLECFITRSSPTSAPTLLALLFTVAPRNYSAFDLNWNLERDLQGTDSICVFSGVWSP